MSTWVGPDGSLWRFVRFNGTWETEVSQGVWTTARQPSGLRRTDVPAPSASVQIIETQGPPGVPGAPGAPGSTFWSDITGKPSVIAAGSDATEARDSIDALDAVAVQALIDAAIDALNLTLYPSSYLYPSSTLCPAA